MTKSITSQLSDNAIYQILEIIASEIDDFEPHYIIDVHFIKLCYYVTIYSFTILIKLVTNLLH